MSDMRFCSDSVKKILACDQIVGGMEFDKRPSNQELVFGHIALPSRMPTCRSARFNGTYRLHT